MVIVCVFGLGRSPAARPMAHTIRLTATANVAARTVSSFLRRLQALGVLEMRDERRPHLHQQSLQLLIRGARNQRLVERVEHLLVIPTS